MSTKLQQVIARSRLSTLDGELRKAAEQMLRDKFFPKNNSTKIDEDILEALQRKNPLDEIYLAMHSPVNGGFKQRIHISRPNLGAIAEAIRRAKMEFRPFDLSSMRLVMGWSFYQTLLGTDGGCISHVRGQISLLGCKIVIDNSGFKCCLEVEF